MEKEELLVVQKVNDLRDQHPIIGTRKLHCMLQPFLQADAIKMGRDGLFNLLGKNKLLVRRRKRRTFTTQSHHWLKKYTNLTKDWHPTAPEQLWVADITYVPRHRGFLYLSLITDAYSHKIVGYHIAETLKTASTVKALQMALLKRKESPCRLIHHSDRGIQYCSSEYVTLLKLENIKISMTENSDPLDNPVAERINGIIKHEYLKHYRINNVDEATDLLRDVVNRYNCLRPHQSIQMKTPETVHEQKLLINKRWNRHKQLISIAT